MSEEKKCMFAQRKTGQYHGDPCFCWSCYQRRGEADISEESWQRIQSFVETIFNHYPGSFLTGFFLDGRGGKGCAVHFHVGCGGSDSVCVSWKGKLSQFLSGDLDIRYLQQLEDKLWHIVNPIPNLKQIFKGDA